MEPVITGGANEYVAAAILAVLNHVEEEAVAARSALRNPNAQPAWLRAGRHQPIGRFNPPVVPDPGINWPNT